MDWISNISDSVIATLENSRMPMQSPPAMPLFCESQIRPGLSATTLASKIISRLPDIGIPTGPNPDGTENIVNKFVRIISEEVVNAIKDDAVVMSSIPMGYIPVTGTGGNAGGPVLSTGYNILDSISRGIIR